MFSTKVNTSLLLRRCHQPQGQVFQLTPPVPLSWDDQIQAVLSRAGE